MPLVPGARRGRDGEGTRQAWHAIRVNGRLGYARETGHGSEQEEVEVDAHASPRDDESEASRRRVAELKPKTRACEPVSVDAAAPHGPAPSGLACQTVNANQPGQPLLRMLLPVDCEDYLKS